MKNFLLRPLLVSYLFLTFCVNTYSQKEFNARELFVEAESFFLFEEYQDALSIYQRILSNEPDNYNVMYKIGICYLNDPYQKARSIKYLSEASGHINPDYRQSNYKEKLAPPDVLFYLGQAYRVNEKLDKAIEYFSQFKDGVDPLIYDLEVINAELASCEIAKKTMRSPVYIKTKILGETINTRFADEGAVLSGDGKTLVYTGKLQFYDAVFIATRDANGNWSQPYNLTPDFGLDGNSVVTGISFSGDEIFVYRSDDFDGNIYSSKKIGDHWQALKKLNENINTKYWESHASPSPDGKYLYFTSNRRGGYGGLDIYRSLRASNGTWGIPVNLGPIINSPYNEDTPFISPSGNMLYFSSRGHGGMGGYDIFVSEKIDVDKWSKPFNMGYPLNTTDDDLFFCPVKINEYTGIYSYYDQNTSYGLKDIYWIEVYNSIIPRLFTINGKVNAPSPDLLHAGKIKAVLIDNKSGKIVAQAPVDSIGVFSLSAGQGSYQLLIDGQGIKPVNVPVELSLNQKNELVDIDLITVMAVPLGEDVITQPIAYTPKLLVKGKNYIVTETIPVSIELEVEKGSDLKVESFVNNELVVSEEFYASKSNFTYVLTPQPGENKVIFTITDKKGNVNQKEIMVYYTPKVTEEALTVVETPTKSSALSEVAILTTGGLQKYLLTLGDVKFDSKTDLYNMLISNTEGNNYTIDDVNELFAIMLTQRNKEEFLNEMHLTSEFDELRLNDSVVDKLEIPFAIVYNTKETFSNSKDKINTGLISMVPYNGSPKSELAYILSFVDKDLPVGISVSETSSSAHLLKINEYAGVEKASEAIDLASTTQALQYFYQNMIISSEGALKEMLTDVDFEKDKIHNSIDLVDYLFKKAPEKGLTIQDLIAAIESAQNTQNINLYKFRESLATYATGELKTTIEGLDLANGNISNFEELLNALLLKSKSKGYSAFEVYNLLLNLIGIDKVDEFAIALGAIAPEQLDSLIKNIDLKQFSKPIELIQYLLAQSTYYDYTESDINNMLLRMLLERGIDNYLLSEEAMHSQKLIKRRRVITTIVLINALLIVLFLLFWRRKKKNQT
jgi:tetratricopeptide (TPR) repeat protein